MKEIIVFIQFIVIAISQSNDQIDCNKYLSKFGTKESPLAFSGDAVYFQESKEVQINVKYIDILFDDPLYFGLVQEDGKQPETTCLKLKVSQLTASNFQSSQLRSDLPITVSNNTANKWRYYSFKIPISSLDQKLVSKRSTNTSIYSGYYAFFFKATNQEDIQYQFFFYYTLTLEQSSFKFIDMKFKSQFLAELADPSQPLSLLLWCVNITCQSYLDESPYIQMIDKFVIQQIIIDSDYRNYQLNNTKVRYTGNGLNKLATPVQIINTTPGRLILELKAEIAWNFVEINVISDLASVPLSLYVKNTIETTFNRLPFDTFINFCNYSDYVIRWCSDITCNAFLEEIPNLHFNDQFIIQQAYTGKFCKGINLTKTEVWLTAYGLHKKAQPIKVINNVLNQVIIQLKAEVVWKNLTIKVISNIEDSSEQISGETNQIQCIKPEGQETCATCKEEYTINGFARDGCEECYNYQFIVFVNMILLFLLNI